MNDLSAGSVGEPAGTHATPTTTRCGTTAARSLALTATMVAAGLLGAGCAPKSVFGQLVHVEERPLDVKGKSLAYLEGSSWGEEPEADAEVRPPSYATDPVLVFVSDLGETCEPYDDASARDFVTRFTGEYVFVRPKSLFEVACGTPESHRLDVAWRHAELDALVASLRKDHAKQPIVLVGEAFGSTIALEWLSKNSSLAQGFVSMGGPLGDVERVFVQVVRESGKEQREITREVDKLRGVFEKLAASPTSAEPLWDRSPAFWSQLRAIDPKARLGALGVPGLVLQGDADTTRVPSSMLASARRELKRAGAEHLSYAELQGVGADLRRREAFEAIQGFVLEKVAKGAAPAAAKPAAATPATEAASSD